MALSEDGMEQAGMGVGSATTISTDTLIFSKRIFWTTPTSCTATMARAISMTLRELLALGSKPDTSVGEQASLIWTTMVFQTSSWLPAMCIRRWNAPCRNIPIKRRARCFGTWGSGVFEELIDEAGPGVAAAHCSRGCAFGDFDNDGDVDVLIINLNEPPSLLRNDLSSKTNWIKVKLEGVKSNRSAIGAQGSSPLRGQDPGASRVEPVQFFFL